MYCTHKDLNRKQNVFYRSINTSFMFLFFMIRSLRCITTTHLFNSFSCHQQLLRLCWTSWDTNVHQLHTHSKIIFTSLSSRNFITFPLNPLRFAAFSSLEVAQFASPHLPPLRPPRLGSCPQSSDGVLLLLLGQKVQRHLQANGLHVILAERRCHVHVHLQKPT